MPLFLRRFGTVLFAASFAMMFESSILEVCEGWKGRDLPIGDTTLLRRGDGELVTGGMACEVRALRLVIQEEHV